MGSRGVPHLLTRAGGAKRIAQYAADRGETVDANAVHQTKSEVFRRHLAESGVAARPGVAETIEAAKASGHKVALVTTTAPENVTALTEALGLDALDLTVDVTDVSTPKPDGACYAYALRMLGETPEACVTIEDNEDGVAAAHAAGLRCLAFPNENTSDHGFADADGRIDRLDLDRLDVTVPAS